jgi:hypothetical protein
MNISIAPGVATLFGLACGFAACSGPTAPSRAAEAEQLTVFLDRETGFTTSDVRDAQDQIVRFNGRGELIWAAAGTRFPGYIADGQVITADRVCVGCYFFVRFGSRGGERRAFLTWAGADANGNAPMLLDLEVVGGRLAVTTTREPVPFE